MDLIHHPMWRCTLSPLHTLFGLRGQERWPVTPLKCEWEGLLFSLIIGQIYVGISQNIGVVDMKPKGVIYSDT